MNDEKDVNKLNEKESFVSLYTRLYNENFEELERLRKKEAAALKKYLFLLY